MAERIEDRLKNLIVERLYLNLKPGELDENASLIDTYGVDSVSLLELVVGIEEVFGVTIEDHEFRVEHFESVARLAAFLRARVPA